MFTKSILVVLASLIIIASSSAWGRDDVPTWQRRTTESWTEQASRNQRRVLREYPNTKEYNRHDIYSHEEEEE